MIDLSFSSHLSDEVAMFLIVLNMDITYRKINTVLIQLKSSFSSIAMYVFGDWLFFSNSTLNPTKQFTLNIYMYVYICVCICLCILTYYFRNTMSSLLNFPIMPLCQELSGIWCAPPKHHTYFQYKHILMCQYLLWIYWS